MDEKKTFLKKITQEYNKDHIFDVIDIQESLTKKRVLSKVNEDKFLYKTKMEQFKFYRDYNPRTKTKSEIIERINKNKFDIRIQDLVIKNENGCCHVLVDKYYPIDLIGQGGFSIVISVYDTIRRENVAIKIIPKFKLNKETLHEFLNREVKIQKMINHKNILQLYSVVDNKDYMYIFMDYMEGGSLKDLIIERYINKDEYLFKDEECALIMRGILEGVNYLHSMNIMHRDLKPENIMFKEKDDLTSLKIVDFGFAVYSDDNRESLKCGTLIYMSPELINKQQYDNSIDIWAAGFVLYLLCSGGKHPLYKSDMDLAKYCENMRKKERWTFTDSFPILARNLFLKLCKYEKNHRYETFKALKHPYISRNPNAEIPDTIIDYYVKKEAVKKFKLVFSFNVDVTFISISTLLQRN
jgi:serine/threonine protein kinase